MNDLVDFLTSQEIIIVYIIAAFACLICFIVYLVEKNNENLRKKHNTKELKKLVEEIRERVPEEEMAMFDIPIVEEVEEETSIQDLINKEPMVIEPIGVEETVDLSEVVQEVQEIEENELEYTSIEPDQETAKLELKRLQEQLEREEQIEQEPEQTAIDVVAAYEDEQEKSAIISLEELLVKSKEMYEANEITQYQDEGNEPISIQDLEMQVQKQATIYNEPFIIANVVPEEELQAGINEAFEQVETKEVLHMDDMNTISKETVNPVVQEPVKRFQASPIISPIFGIEKASARDNAIALENTANYEKLDAAIRSNNEFYMTMNELQGKTE